MIETEKEKSKPTKHTKQKLFYDQFQAFDRVLGHKFQSCEQAKCAGPSSSSSSTEKNNRIKIEREKQLKTRMGLSWNSDKLELFMFGVGAREKGSELVPLTLLGAKFPSSGSHQDQREEQEFFGFFSMKIQRDRSVIEQQEKGKSWSESPHNPRRKDAMRWWKRVEKRTFVLHILKVYSPWDVLLFSLQHLSESNVQFQ